MPDQPTPGQVAGFDQTLAALGTNLDALITVYGGQLADGEHPGVSTAGLAKWLLAQGDAVALAEHLAAAIRRLHETGAAYERGLAEGRRQATEGAAARAEAAMRAESDRLAAPGTARAVEQGIGVAHAMSAVRRAIAGPWEPAEQKASNE